MLGVCPVQLPFVSAERVSWERSLASPSESTVTRYPLEIRFSQFILALLRKCKSVARVAGACFKLPLCWDWSTANLYFVRSGSTCLEYAPNYVSPYRGPGNSLQTNNSRPGKSRTGRRRLTGAPHSTATRAWRSQPGWHGPPICSSASLGDVSPT
ncbi:hypothetical protein VTK56DRAFT_1714 [Thermocarpiscus australiensis]